jgi:hypothetical protein
MFPLQAALAGWGRSRRPTRSRSIRGDEIHLGSGQRFRVLDVVPFEEEDESPFVGLLKVEANVVPGD